MGGSSGGGGGGSGQVGWPNYLQEVHYGALSNSGLNGFTKSMASVINDAVITNPIYGLLAFDPSSDITSMEAAIAAFEVDITGYDPTTVWEDTVDVVNAKLDSVISESTITTASAAYSASLQDEIDDEILPRYRVGMRDLNMINTSAYAIGEALIAGKKLKEIAKFEGDLRIKNEVSRWDGMLRSVDKISEDVLNKVKLKQATMQISVDATRIAIVASKEYTDKQLELVVMEERWDMECYQALGNLIAAVSGGTSTNPQRGVSSGQSAIGGALSGTAAGAMIGSAFPGIGTGVGAAVGGLIGIGSSFL